MMWLEIAVVVERKLIAIAKVYSLTHTLRGSIVWLINYSK